MIKYKDDSWLTHARWEIHDAFCDPDLLLQITNALKEMERLDLIPDEIASELFGIIDWMNKQPFP